MNINHALSLQNILKVYPGVVALDNVDFFLRPGEIRALLGKNGAGKSTLIRIACGLEKPDKGTIYVRDQPVVLKKPAEARRQGIEIVSQELNIIPHLDVAENISLGRWPKRGGRLDRSEMRRLAVDALARLNVEINPDLLVKNISPAQQQLVEIAKALSRNPSVLLLDEPTSSLALPEVVALLKTVKNIASQGVSVIYVSHRLAEIAQVADSVTILRNGKLVITAPINELNDQDIIAHMIGDMVEFNAIEASNFESEPIVLSVENITIAKRVENVSFELHKGEVLGLAGLLGTGRSEILRVIAGFEHVKHGQIKLVSGNEKEYRPNVQHMIKNGVALSPEDRRDEGIIPRMGVSENIAIGRWNEVSKIGNISWNKVRDITLDLVRRLSIKTPSIDTPIMNLSGGNQQKVVIGRWLDIADHVLLLDEPTRGVDVESKGQIYDIIRDAAKRGVSIIVVASELEELLWCCQSIIFLHGGKASRKYLRSELNLEMLNSLANGGTSSL
jgi:simple sugar transport system ATP-binding protein